MSKASVPRTLVSSIKLIIDTASAKPGPPVGPVLGQAGLNIMAFCKDFNAKSGVYKEGLPLRVAIRVYNDKTYDYSIKLPATTWFIKKAAGLVRGVSRPGHETLGVISLKHIYEIAKLKTKEIPYMTEEIMCKKIMGSCRSMGVRVVAKPEDA
mmetsp:Transcript_28841/g.52975  ORF Transcript_28841/g.52975 Transcript_28841/m.52975 type:complete len:153 (-) Transcript_28841:119-577(-)